MTFHSPFHHIIIEPEQTGVRSEVREEKQCTFSNAYYDKKMVQPCKNFQYPRKRRLWGNYAKMSKNFFAKKAVQRCSGGHSSRGIYKQKSTIIWIVLSYNGQDKISLFRQSLCHFIGSIFQCCCNQEFHAGIFENFSSFNGICTFKADNHGC